jgi:FdrA protein
MENKKNTLAILTKPKVINVGLEIFAKELTSQGFDVTHVDWKPPAGGDPELASLLAKLTS